MKWKLYDDLGATEATRREWKGRSDADRLAGANERTPERVPEEISRGHFETLTECWQKVLGSQPCSSGGRGRGNRLKDAAIGAAGRMLDEPNWNESTAEAFVRIRREQGKSDKQIEREARVDYHSDRQPQNLRGTADAFVAEVSQILRRR